MLFTRSHVVRIVGRSQQSILVSEEREQRKKDKTTAARNTYYCSTLSPISSHQLAARTDGRTDGVRATLFFSNYALLCAFSCPTPGVVNSGIQEPSPPIRRPKRVAAVLCDADPLLCGIKYSGMIKCAVYMESGAGCAGASLVRRAERSLPRVSLLMRSGRR